MIKYLFAFLISLPLLAANIYDSNTGVYRTSVDTNKYLDGEGNPLLGILINPDISAVTAIPQKYWKVDGNALVEMSQAEKDAVDLPLNKAAKKRVIEANTRTLLLAGFAYDGVTFPSDPASRERFKTIYESAKAGLKTYPVTLGTSDDGTYSVADQAAFDTLYVAAVAWGLAIVDGEVTLLKAVKDAADQAALDAVVDNR